jgi:UDP-N-acetylmuramyl pentapeptide synthase
VLVADASAPVLSTIIPALTSDDYLIINADDADIFSALGENRAKVITYGFNSRACITASSVTEDGLQLCIQRSFVDLGGNTRSPQEFSAPVTYLGAAAAWAVVG